MMTEFALFFSLPLPSVFACSLAATAATRPKRDAASQTQPNQRRRSKRGGGKA
jgi:hypothetical protein